MSLFGRKSSVDIAERRTREARRQLEDVLDRLHQAIDRYEEQTKEVTDARDNSSSDAQ